MISLPSDWVLTKHILLDSSQGRDSNGGKIIAIGSILTRLLYFKVLYYFYYLKLCNMM